MPPNGEDMPPAGLGHTGRTQAEVSRPQSRKQHVSHRERPSEEGQFPAGTGPATRRGRRPRGSIAMRTGREERRLSNARERLVAGPVPEPPRAERRTSARALKIDFPNLSPTPTASLSPGWCREGLAHARRARKPTLPADQAAERHGAQAIADHGQDGRHQGAPHIILRFDSTPTINRSQHPIPTAPTRVPPTTTPNHHSRTDHPRPLTRSPLTDGGFPQRPPPRWALLRRRRTKPFTDHPRPSPRTHTRSSPSPVLRRADHPPLTSTADQAPPPASHHPSPR